MNKELLKTVRSSIPKEPKVYKERWEIRCCGDGIRSAFFEKKHIERRLDDVDIALLSYFYIFLNDVLRSNPCDRIFSLFVC